MFKLAILCTKHPGFHEEQEWRIVYSPSFHAESKYPEKRLRVIGGVPQHVYAIPLDNIPEVGLKSAIPQIFDRLIIGPTSYKNPLGRAFQQLLKDAGVEDVESKIFISDIPIRQ